MFNFFLGKMKKKLLLMLVLICSIALSIKSYRYANNSSLLISGNIEALSDDDLYEIVCGRDEGLCWAGEEYTVLGIEKWRCPYWTGSMTSQCKNGVRTGSTDYVEWYLWAKDKGII